MSKPLVSIVITAFRSRPDHLRGAIASALAQSWERVEVIVSDDSPDDALRPLVDAFADPRIRYTHHRPSLGVARNHWWCFGRAKGEYVAILNHDDSYEVEFVESAVSPLEREPKAALAFCDHWVMDATGRRLFEESDATSRSWGRSDLREGLQRSFLRLLVNQTIPMAMGTVFRRSLLPMQLPDHAGPAYDLWLTYLLARGGHGAYYVPRRLSSWRMHEANLTSQRGADWLDGSTDCWLAIGSDPACIEIRSPARAKAARALTANAVRALGAGRRAECSRLARHSLNVAFTPAALTAWSLSVLPAPIVKPIMAWVRSRSHGALTCPSRRPAEL